MSHGAAVAPPGPKIVQSGEQEGEAAWTGGYKQTNKQTQDARGESACSVCVQVCVGRINPLQEVHTAALLTHTRPAERGKSVQVNPRHSPRCQEQPHSRARKEPIGWCDLDWRMER